MADHVCKPAEWQRQDAVWVSPPANAETWPGCLDAAAAEFDTFVGKLSQVVAVRDVATLGIATEDAWIRDYGPLFVLSDGEPVVCDFAYNAWGEKYGDGRIDNAVPAQIAGALQMPCVSYDLVLEGGAIESDGQGTGFTTASCLFHPSRNAGRSREQIIDTVRTALGFETLHILPGGDLPGDDTDGHIDNLVRCLSPTLLAYVDPDEAAQAGASSQVVQMLRDNLAALHDLRRSDGEPYDLLALPTLEPISFDYPGDRWTPARREMLPTSYANFLISNGTLFLPAFDQRQDELALRRLEAAGLGLAVEPVRCRSLLVGQGGLHCLTQQQPAADGLA